jgi:cysteine desulfurase
MIYLDHNATAPLCAPAREAWIGAHDSAFANPSSLHRPGQRAERALDSAREQLAEHLGSQAADLVWTSGATESANAIIAHLSRQTSSAIAVSEIEHPCVLEAAQRWFEGRLKIIPTDGTGVVQAAKLQALLSSESIGAVAVMAANNETGALQPWREIQQLCTQTGVPFVCDATQWIGRLPASDLGMCDYVFASGHKFGAPKGIGALFIRRDTPLEPMFHGGSQDRGRRPGTENVAFAVGLATAAELLLAEHEAEHVRLSVMRAALEQGLRERIPDVVIHAEGAPRAPHITNVSIPGTSSESMLMALDLRGIACSAGSACQSGSVAASHVLSAMGVSPDIANAALRLSFGCLSTDADVQRTLDVLTTLSEKSRVGKAASAACAFEPVEF